MWHVMGWAVSDVSKNHYPFIFRAKRPFFLYFLTLKRHKDLLHDVVLHPTDLSWYIHFAWTRMCRSNKSPVIYCSSTCGITKLATNILYVMFKCGHMCIFIFFKVELNSQYIGIRLSACPWGVGFRYLSVMWLCVARLFPGILKQATWCLHVVSKCRWQVLHNLLQLKYY